MAGDSGNISNQQIDVKKVLYSKNPALKKWCRNL